MSFDSFLIDTAKLLGWISLNYKNGKKGEGINRIDFCGNLKMYRIHSVILILGTISFSFFYIWYYIFVYDFPEKTVYLSNQLKCSWDFVTCCYLLINGFCKSLSLDFLFKMKYNLQESEISKVPKRMRTDYLFLITCFLFIPIEIFILAKLTEYKENLSQRMFELIIYRIMGACITIPSALIVLIFYKLTIQIILSFKKIQEIFKKQLNLLKNSKSSLLEVADVLNKSNIQMLYISLFIKEISNYFTTSFVFIMTYAFFSTLLETFYLIYADSLEFIDWIWIGVMILHYLSYFIPIIATPSFFLYQVIVYKILNYNLIFFIIV